MKRRDPIRVRVDGVSFVGRLVVAHGATLHRDRRRFIPTAMMAEHLVRELRHGRQAVVTVPAEALYR